MAAETQLVDDGTGTQELWRVRKFGLEEVEDKFEGIFFTGDCYLLKYTYLNGSKEQYILYYWLVRNDIGVVCLRKIKVIN
jgi:gelsolin